MEVRRHLPRPIQVDLQQQGDLGEVVLDRLVARLGFQEPRQNPVKSARVTHAGIALIQSAQRFQLGIGALAEIPQNFVRLLVPSPFGGGVRQ